MNLKPALVLLASMAACPFQTQASLCNGGFENGLACWRGLTEEFGFKEVVSSYIDGSGKIFTPTEGSYFVSLWGSNDLAQEFSWSIGDQLSFDWIAVSGTNPIVSNASIFAGLFDGLSPLETLLHSAIGNASIFNTFNHTFTQDSPDDGLLVFQALGIFPGQGNTNEEVGHILIDNIQFNSTSDPDAEIPEPDTILLLAFALMFGWISYKTRRCRLSQGNKWASTATQSTSTSFS